MAKKNQVVYTKHQRERDIELKKYHCSDCNKSFRDITTLDNHLAGLKHNPRATKFYICVCCNYTTKLHGNLRIHHKSKKHIEAEALMTANDSMEELKNVAIKLFTENN